MNRDLIDWVWQQSKTKGHDLLVLLALAYKANVVGEATITLTELAALCRIRDDEARVSLRVLVKLNEIIIFQNHDGAGNRTTNTYKFAVASRGQINGEEDDISFDEPSLPGIPVPKVRDLPKEPQPKLMMDKASLAAIAADPLYEGMDVNAQAWKFKRWCAAHQKDTTVRRFKEWLARV